MSDQHETIADICARIRKIDESMMRDIDFMAVFLEFLPRDIDAAAERERQDAMKTALLAKCKVCEKVGPASAPGDAAAMRDALNRVGHLAKDLRNITERDTEVRADVNEIVDVCRTALRAPARNCDRFATEDEAREAYWAYREPLEFNNKPFVAITEWLFAPAEGKEADHA